MILQWGERPSRDKEKAEFMWYSCDGLLLFCCLMSGCRDTLQVTGESVFTSLVWWWVLVMPTHERQRKEGLKFKGSLNYTMQPCLKNKSRCSFILWRITFWEVCKETPGQSETAVGSWSSVLSHLLFPVVLDLMLGKLISWRVKWEGTSSSLWLLRKSDPLLPRVVVQLRFEGNR